MFLYVSVSVAKDQSEVSFGMAVDEEILLATDRDPADRFGSSVSINNNRVLVGASNDDENGNSAGAAYVFEPGATGWVETAKIIADDGDEDDLFGRSVSLFGDRALIGAVFEEEVTNQGSIGAAYVFEYDGMNWVQKIKLTADDGTPGNRFGEGVSVSGNRALISATGQDDDFGAVYVFDLVNGEWEQSAKLIAPLRVDDDLFGRSISLLGDRALISSYGDGDVMGDRTGAVFVFDLVNGAWVETIKLTAHDGVTDDQFGSAVSLGIDRALIGAQLADNPDFTGPSPVNWGAVYVFDLDNGIWSQTTKFFNEEGAAFDSFGSAVSLYGDKALIGVERVDGISGFNAGAAYLYHLVEGQWVKVDKILASDQAANDRFGNAVSISDSHLLIAASANDSRAGSAYLYKIDLIYKNGFEIGVKNP